VIAILYLNLTIFANLTIVTNFRSWSARTCCLSIGCALFLSRRKLPDIVELVRKPLDLQDTICYSLLSVEKFVNIVKLVRKRSPKLIEYSEEKYVTVSEVAKRLKIAYSTCKSNVVPLLTACYLPGRRRPVYKQSEVEQLSQVRIVEKQVQPLTLIKQDHEVAYTEDNLCREAL